MKKIWETLVIDRSGSMQPIRQQVITTINERIQQAKQNSQDGDEITLNIITFDGNIYENTWGTKAIDVPEATTGDYNPNGGTALYDAIGYTLKKIEKTCEDSETEHLVVVITDGEDTSSTHFNDTVKLKSLISEHQANGKVTVTYVGCDEKKVLKEAQKLGILANNCAAWDNSNSRISEASFKNMNSRLYHYYDNRKKGVKLCSNIMSDANDEKITNFAVVEESIDVSEPTHLSVMGLAVSPQNYGPLQYGIASSCCVSNTTFDAMNTSRGIVANTNVAGNHKIKKANWDEVMA